MDKAIITINEFSRNVAKRMKKEDVYSTDDIDWRNDVSGKTIREGDRIDLGDLKVSILDILGHSSCCIAAYVPKLKALFPTDGGGIPFARILVIRSELSVHRSFLISLSRTSRILSAVKNYVLLLLSTTTKE